MDAVAASGGMAGARAKSEVNTLGMWVGVKCEA